MLRTLSLTAPVVAAFMIVVLLVEPPALRPTERLPTLRMLTARAGRGLDRAQMQAAIAWGREGEPGSYVLGRVPSVGDRTRSLEPAGVVFTPFLRVAWAAHVRQTAGRPLRVDEVPPWMAAPIVYLVLRAPPAARADATGMPAIAVVPPDTGTCCLDPQPTLMRPLWMTDDPGVLARFGAAVPFSDLGIIAAFPVEVLRGDVEVAAFYRVDGPDGPSSVEMRGRFPSELAAWR